MKTWMYIVIGIVVIVILYFVFRKKPDSEPSEQEINNQVQQLTQNPTQAGYTSSVAQIIQSLTGLVDASTGGGGFTGSNSQPVNS
jgi:uncharacterized membrane protein YfcA